MLHTRPASKNDLSTIQALLKSLGLPSEDCDCHVHNFMVVESDGVIIAAGGLEVYAEQALLRSLVVAPAYQGQGLGNALYNELRARAQSLGVAQLFVITETASGYFFNRGFSNIERCDVPQIIKSTRQFSALCPESAAVMCLEI